MFKVAPLKSSFMLISMLGFMVTVVYTSFGRISETWGFTFGFVFALMFIASFISMTNAPIDIQLKMAEDFSMPHKKRSESAPEAPKEPARLSGYRRR